MGQTIYVQEAPVEKNVSLMEGDNDLGDGRKVTIAHTTQAVAYPWINIDAWNGKREMVAWTHLLPGQSRRIDFEDGYRGTIRHEGEVA